MNKIIRKLKDFQKTGQTKLSVVLLGGRGVPSDRGLDI